jgi:phosphoribosylformylglycinamidine cyclo-ligase
VHGLAHITGDGVLNLLRLSETAGFELDAPLPVPPVFGLIARAGGIDDAELYRVFNMGCGFCCVVPRERAQAAVTLLEGHHPGAAVIGRVTAETAHVRLPSVGLVGEVGRLNAA